MIEKGTVVKTFAVAIIVGLVLFSTIALALHFIKGPLYKNPSLKNIVGPVSLLVGVVAVYAARFMYNKRMSALSDNIMSDQKNLLTGFQSAVMIHYALCEAPALASIICFIVFGDYLFFVPVGMALIEMIRKFPSQDKINGLSQTGV